MSWGSSLSDFVRAWYVFVGLALLTFALAAFVGRLPAGMSAAVALPHVALYRSGIHLRAAWDSMLDRRQTRAEVVALRERLAESDAALRLLELQIVELEALLDVRRRQTPAARVTAPVVGRVSTGVSDSLTVGAGLAAGVVQQMPVTSAGGLVGLVVDTTARTAVVRTLLDPQSRVGVTIRGKGGQGVAVGDVGGLIRVDRFIGDSSVAVGDVIETSAIGGLFPRGLLVGVVVEVLPQDPNELRRSFLVAPAADFTTLLDVVLIDRP